MLRQLIKERKNVASTTLISLSNLYFYEVCNNDCHTFCKFCEVSHYGVCIQHLLHIVDKSLTCFPEYLTADRIMKLLSPENPSIPHCCVLFDNKQGDHSDWNLVKEFLSGTHIK